MNIIIRPEVVSVPYQCTNCGALLRVFQKDISYVGKGEHGCWFNRCMVYKYSITCISCGHTLVGDTEFASICWGATLTYLRKLRERNA